MRRTTPWLALGGATAGAGWALGQLGVPSSYLFAALLVGIACALRWPGRLELAPGAFTGAQVVTGVTLGTYLESSALDALADDWLAVTLVSAATLALSLGTGAVLARTTDVDGSTATLGMIAGGASGIVAMARQLGGDDRLVAFMQYIRLLIIVLLTPVLAAIAFPGHHLESGPAAGPDPLLGAASGWLWTLGAGVAGLVVGWATRLPAGALLGPMIVMAVFALSGPGDHVAVPALLRESAFALIGLHVGLRFTVDTLRATGQLLVPVLGAMLALLVACFGLAVVLAVVTPASLLDAYLATTPGGLYAVLAVAVGAGANTTFIVGVQGIRLLVMVLLAPAALRGLRRLGYA